LIEGQNVDNFLTFIESSLWAPDILFFWHEIGIISLPVEKNEENGGKKKAAHNHNIEKLGYSLLIKAWVIIH
jgi:hypothetical protein